MGPEQAQVGCAAKSFLFCMMVLCAAWGGHLRFFALDTQGFWLAEGVSVVHALSILREGYPLLPSGEVAWNGVGAHYLLALGLRLFDDMHTGARFFSAAAGTLLLPVFYVMNVHFTRSRFQALTATLLLALMSYEIAWSRQACVSIYLQLYAVASLAALFSWLEGGGKDRLALSFLLAGTAALTHRAGLIAFLVILLAAPLRPKAPEGEAKKMSTPILMGSVLAALLLAGTALLSWPGLADAVRGLGEPSAKNHLYDYGGFLAFQLGYAILWLPLGIVVALWKRPRLALPLLLATGCYIFVIGLKTPLLNYHSLLPVLPFLVGFLALGFTSLLRGLWSVKGVAAAAAVVLPALFFISVYTGQFQLFPRGSYGLGETLPRPEWREAYRWIADRSGGKKPATLSTAPLWHDIYLGERGGEKYFLPFFATSGKHVRSAPLHSRAKTLRDYRALYQVEGFAVLDDASFPAIADEAVRQRLVEVEPAAYFKAPEGGELYIWRLPLK